MTTGGLKQGEADGAGAMARRLARPCILPTGFTLIELMMGMVVTTMVLGALAAFTTAMGQSWSGSGSVQTPQTRQTVVTARISDVLRNALAVGVVAQGSLDTSSTETAGVMLWLSDDLIADGKIEWGELGWLAYDPTSHTLRLYQCKSPMSFVQAFSAKQKLQSSMWVSETLPEIFTGLNFVTSRVLASDVVAARFATRNPGDVNGRPSVEFTLVLNPNGVQEVCYGNAALRNATTPAY